MMMPSVKGITPWMMTTMKMRKNNREWAELKDGGRVLPEEGNDRR
jgi:hypothetical protein